MNHESLRKELERMYDADQAAYDPKVVMANTRRLKEIVNTFGWPTAESAGTKGELAVFLIVQHSNETAWQEKLLAHLQKLPPSVQRRESIALLTDRILVNKGLPQVYGTQFRQGGPYPIKDLEGLEQRRKAMGLQPFEQYKQHMLKRQNTPNL